MAATATKTATPSRVKPAAPAGPRHGGSAAARSRSRAVLTRAKLVGHQIAVQDGRICFRGDYQMSWDMDLAGARAFHQALGETIAKLERRAK